MKRSSLATLLALPLLAACGGGGGGVTSTPVSLPPAASAPSVSLSEAQSDALSLQTRGPIPSSAAEHLLYVGNVGNNSITVYDHAAAGNHAPLYVIGGSKTGISSPGQLSQDAQGNLYVANGSNVALSTNPAILVFAHGANGNVAPIRKLAGTRTGIAHVQAMTVDVATGKIFVADNGVGDGNSLSLVRFPPNATGNEAPFASGTIGFFAYQLASDSTGKNIIDAHEAECCSSPSAGILTYPKQFSANASLNFGSEVDSLWPYGVADDPTTKTYLVTSSSGIYRLRENTAGSGPFGSGGAATWKPTPVSVITSDTCGTQLAVAPGSAPPTYVVNSASCTGNSYGSVSVYANNASGNAAPLRILSGLATKMNQPYGIYEGL